MTNLQPTSNAPAHEATRRRSSRWSHQRRIAKGLCLSLALVASACVQAPENDQWVTPWEVDFVGYAENQGALIEVQALDKHTGGWVTIATTNASDSPSSFDSGVTQMFRWSVVDLDTTAPPQCIWGDGAWVNCPISAGSAQAQFRVREVGSSTGTLTTFDAGGISCVVNELVAGTDWVTAGFSCRSTDTPIITLNWLT